MGTELRAHMPRRTSKERLRGDLAAAHALLARLKIRADEPTAVIAARVMEALAYSNASPMPMLRHDDAAAVGERVASKWEQLVGSNAPPADDLFWADLVQYVLHSARAVARDRLDPADTGL